MGIVLFHKNQRLSYLSFIIALSCITALCIHYEQISFSRKQPYAFYQIDKAVGKIVKDSKEITGGREILPLEMLSVSGFDTTEITHSIYRTFLIRGNKRFYKGEIIQLSFKRPVKFGTGVLFVDKKNIEHLGWESPLSKIREEILNSLNGKINLMNPPARTLFTAFFLGRRAEPQNPLFQDFTHAGASHLLALSGMHLGILSGMVTLLLAPLFGNKKAFLVSLPLLLLYLFLTGLSPSLLRAYIFLCLIGVGAAANIKPNYFHLLILTFAIHCLLDPLSFSTISFKLSYLALTGIMLFSGVVQKALPGVIPPNIRSALAASVGAQLGTLPAVVFFFQTVYPIGIVSSLFLITLTAVFMFLGIIFLIVPVGVLLEVFLFLVNISGSILSHSVALFAHVPALAIDSQYTLPVVLTLVFLVVYFFIRKVRAK